MLTDQKSGLIPLESTYEFAAGAIDRFKVSLDDVGKVSKLRVWHDNTGKFPGWCLEKVKNGII